MIIFSGSDVTSVEKVVLDLFCEPVKKDDKR
jgi:hypothetical protein